MPGCIGSIEKRWTENIPHTQQAAIAEAAHVVHIVVMTLYARIDISNP